MEEGVILEYILKAAEAAEIDRISIYETGIPSAVLMEKAAMSVARHIPVSYTHLRAHETSV